MNRFDLVFGGRASSYVPNEGLIVLLCDLMRNLAVLDTKVVVHTTDRHEPFLRKALAMNGIEPSAVELRAYAVGSAGLNRSAGPQRKRERGRGPLVAFLGRGARAVASAARTLLLWNQDIGLGNVFQRALVVPLTALALVLLVIPALAAAVIGFLLVAGLAVARRLPRVGRRVVPAHRYPAELRLLTTRLKAFASGIRRDVDDELYRREQIRLARALNRARGVDVFFLFSAFEGGLVRALKRPSVIVFPDAVPMHFPTRFSDAVSTETLRQMRMAVEHAAGIVCYSEFVRDRQLARLYPEAASRKPVAVIPQGYFPARSGDRAARRAAATARLNAQRDRIANVFPELLRNRPVPQFGSFDFVLYPTIDRQHKNVLTLVRACARLLRAEHRNVKLVLTTPQAMPEAHEFIVRERLHYDVLFMPSVPGDVLDDLCAAATVVVHPSLAEGGDVFNFSRAVSNGTPALLADIPVVREMFERAGFDRPDFAQTLFDPFDDRALARRIATVLDDGAPLLAQQTRLLSRLSAYGYPEMAHRYLQFMRKISNGQAHSSL